MGRLLWRTEATEGVGRAAWTEAPEDRTRAPDAYRVTYVVPAATLQAASLAALGDLFAVVVPDVAALPDA